MNTPVLDKHIKTFPSGWFGRYPAQCGGPSLSNCVWISYIGYSLIFYWKNFGVQNIIF